MVVVADGDLQQVPFAALEDPATHRFFVEEHALLLSPSASFFVAGLAHSRELGRQPLGAALLVGNPSASPASDLRALPAAETEVIAASAFYSRHTVLTGRSATKESFLNEAAESDVVHFGGHAILNGEFPLMSRLVFAPTGGIDDGPTPLFVREMAGVRLPHTRLVVLAACSTGAGTVSRGEGVVSVARPFLAAGVPIVVASQWDVDNQATEALFVAFHRAFAVHPDAVAALRAAQLSLLKGSNPLFTAPRHWSAFVALGTSAP